MHNINSHYSQFNNQYLVIKRMKKIATSLLIIMSIIYIITISVKLPYWWISYVRAFSEAAMVGALADWFAATALFRKPMGLPIPHTAIIPSNKIKIAKSIGQFAADNFLSKKEINRKLINIDITSLFIKWILKENNLETFSHFLITNIPRLSKIVPENEFKKLIDESARRGAEKLPLALLSSHILDILWMNGEAQLILDRALIYLGDLLAEKETYIKYRISANAPKWMPKWVDSLLLERVMTGLVGSLRNLRNPTHPWRKDINKSIQNLIHELEHDKNYHIKAEAIKLKILSDPIFVKQIENLWNTIEETVIADFTANHSELQKGLYSAIFNVIAYIQANETLKLAINRNFRLTVIQLLSPRKDQVGEYINEIIQNWDSTTLVNKIELNVGKDLQFIRINGTLIGGIVGVIIYQVTRWIEITY